MSAYAALVSVIHIIDQIQNQTSLSFFLDNIQIESLRKKIVFLLDFMEVYSYSHGGSSTEAEFLEMQIAYAAYAAEDLIESHVVDRIHAGATPEGEKEWKLRYETYLIDFLSGLEKVMMSLDSIAKRVTNIEGKTGFKDEQQPVYSLNSISAASSRHPTTTEVGFDDDVIRLMERLVGQHSNRQVIPIVGMGGIGKTTLAINVYDKSIIVQHFDIRAWVTISHSYNVGEILYELLSCCGVNVAASTSVMDGQTKYLLGEQLYKSLSGRRYLIVMDDIWSIEAWDSIKLFLPDNGNGSRIVVTTRLSNLAAHFGYQCLEMSFLDEDKSWNLFCEKAYVQESCPPELEEVGKKIAKKCKGLPLLIVVIAGLLKKSYRTREYWENVAKNINSFMNLEDDESRCLNILSLSYSLLPAHLKPCFLYTGIFPEDHEIPVSRLIKLWVAEGFLRPNNVNTLEEVAENYLKDLIDRNLILVGRRGSSGKIKTCRIHDILRDLCLKVAQKEKFLSVVSVLDIPRELYMERRIVFHDNISMKLQSQVFLDNEPASQARSLIFEGWSLQPRFRLLRVVNAVRNPLRAISTQVNLRYLAYRPEWRSTLELPSSISLLWNMQTLVIRGPSRGSYSQTVAIAPPQIWTMQQLRHLEFDEVCLPPVPSDDENDDDVVLKNLQTLRTVVDFRCTEEVVKRIPNIKKLKIRYKHGLGSYYCLRNLACFGKLESLYCTFLKTPNRGDLLQNLTFPDSLVKLTLLGCKLHWEDLTMIGSLPRLEVLDLSLYSTTGPEWSPVEGQFVSLKFLQMYSHDLISWNADNTHFPVLEKLVLEHFHDFNIPQGIGDIPTLDLIHLKYCGYTVAVSAKNILEEQQSLGNESLQVVVWHLYESKELESLVMENFQVQRQIQWE